MPDFRWAGLGAVVSLNCDFVLLSDFVCSVAVSRGWCLGLTLVDGDLIGHFRESVSSQSVGSVRAACENMRPAGSEIEVVPGGVRFTVPSEWAGGLFSWGVGSEVHEFERKRDDGVVALQMAIGTWLLWCVEGVMPYRSVWSLVVID